ncbi:glycosyltransferase family 1 protein [Lentinula edodes]|uniref:Glycosyltransferase family 1 protein n=1 Tax=Lentinula edodes TaxID=5353 RepID=A0A1Q3E8X1_LENED|nr:hypothetical protein F5877DRAFT_78771 [Lentinula edodes]GAW03549.1 glycosyltransferase family 1 protein [Lentinula edodes]
MGSIIASNITHVVVHAMAAAWGHNKPLCALVVHILEDHPEIVVTYFTASGIYSKIIAELKRLEPARYAAIESRMNIIDIAGPDFDFLKPLDTFESNFQALYSSSHVTCLTTKKTINGLPRPTLAIIDPFTPYAFESIRKTAGQRVSILAWWTSNAGSLLRLLGPAHLGGVAEPALETSEGRAEMKEKIFAGEHIKWHEFVGKVVNIPGIGPSYDYEWFPQQTVITNLAAVAEKNGTIYIREADGVICVSAASFEPEVEAVVKEWFASMNKAWYTVGPLSIHSPTVNLKPLQTKSETDILVEAFLNRIQKEFGAKSLLYMSFGTAWWPEQDDRVWAVIDGLIEKRQPFLFSHPSPFMHFPNEVKKKIDASGIALELSWSPQELILTHPVTGWFLTHGGWNSMQEAFTHCIPMIFWPFHADQPYTVMRMLALKAGIELIEVRTGIVGARMPYKCDELPAFTPESAKAEILSVVEKLKGEEGLVIRQNFEAVARAVGKAWDAPDGESRKNFLAMLKKFL